MASAGRILIMPKGNWDANTEYEMLDLVFHNETSWLAKKNVVGIEPSEDNSEHWHKLVSIVLTDYLSLAGGAVRGQLGAGNGRVVINGNEYGAVLQSFNDDENYRNIRVDNPMQGTDADYWLKLVNCIDGVVTDYRIFGEHNLRLLKNSIFKTISYSGTTDANGILSPGDITVDTSDIVSCRITSHSGFCTYCNNTGGHWTFKVTNENGIPFANQTVRIRVVYMPY